MVKDTVHYLTLYSFIGTLNDSTIVQRSYTLKHKLQLYNKNSAEGSSKVHVLLVPPSKTSKTSEYYELSSNQQPNAAKSRDLLSHVTSCSARTSTTEVYGFSALPS